MPDPNHDPEVAYADIVVAGHAIDLSAWECWTHRDGDVVYYYARGPCPVCRAPTQGRLDETLHPIESLGPPSDEETPADARPSEPVEIPVRCTCGHDHGRDNATGCDRRWSILCAPRPAVTPVAPVGAGTPDPLDLDAAEQLQHNEDARLVRARAEKWIGGVSALTAVLATALVIKGPDDATQIPLGWRIAAAAALAGAIALLALATYRAYRAAFGKPNALREITPTLLTGLHNRLVQARKTAADDALRDLGAAIRAVFVAIVLIATAVAITWFATTKNTAKPPSSVCVFTRGQLVARLNADITAVNATSTGTTIKRCP